MTVHRLKSPCWLLSPSLPSDDGWHHEDEAAARKAVREYQEENPADKFTAAAKPLSEPCWVVQCDGECGQAIDQEGEGYVFHHTSRADAEESVRQWRFAYLGDSELVYCETDRPEGAEIPPPSPAELEAAGQLVLPGVA
jgi:hypothetical protein